MQTYIALRTRFGVMYWDGQGWTVYADNREMYDIALGTPEAVRLVGEAYSHKDTEFLKDSGCMPLMLPE